MNRASYVMLAALALIAPTVFGSRASAELRARDGGDLRALHLSSIGETVPDAPLPLGACPAGTLPDGTICVHLPSSDDPGGEDAPLSRNAHRVRSGAWTEYDQIPRLPERPADYAAYRYPTPPGLPGGKSVVSGYDLDRPDDSQRRGRTLKAVGHGGVDLPNARGTPVTMLALEHQQGDAEVLFVGTLFGTTVVTKQTVREGGQLRDYVVLFGHLDSTAPGLVAGAQLKEGDPVGAVGDTGSPELVHLHYEVRRVRDDVDLSAKLKMSGPGALVQNEVTVVCDPRNVLPLR